jgi:hypothetical protein
MAESPTPEPQFAIGDQTQDLAELQTACNSAVSVKPALTLTGNIQQEKALAVPKIKRMSAGIIKNKIKVAPIKKQPAHFLTDLKQNIKILMKEKEGN